MQATRMFALGRILLPAAALAAAPAAVAQEPPFGGRGVCTADVTPPVITCPPDITILVQAPITPDYTGWATAIDDCDGPLSPPSLSYRFLGSPPCPLPRVRRWTATDAAGNAAFCDQTITRVHPHDCCQTQTAMVPGCSDPDIEACVCAVSSFCCTEKWDLLCVGLVAQCGSACTTCTDPCNAYPPPHDCCYSHGAGCSNSEIEAAVCAASGYCCTDRWDDTCVGVATGFGFCPAGDCWFSGFHPPPNGVPDYCEANCDHDSRADTCENNPPTCPSGACCIGLVCETVVEEACALRHGSYAGDGTTCTAGLCDDCNHNALVDQAEVQSGQAADCNANGVPDECETDADLDDDGVPDECGACCQTSGRCANTLPAACPVGTHYGAGTTCGEIPCGFAFGACCQFGAGTCTHTTAGACTGGSFQGSGTLCAAASCVDCNANGTRDADEASSGASPDCNGNLVPDGCDVLLLTGDCNFSLVPDECEDLGGDCDGNGIPDECDMMAGSIDCNGDNVPDVCQLEGNDCNGNGILDLCEQSPLFVRPPGSVTGTQDGSSWTTAYASLHNALACLRGDGSIWVAAGTYTPGAPGERGNRFHLPGGAKLYGGFSGSETTLAQRRPFVNLTILSGDLAGNDGAAFANRTDNSNCIVTAMNTSEATLIDGFVIAGAFQQEVEPGEGALTVSGGSLTVRNCTLKDNLSTGLFAHGAAASITNAEVLLENCTFSNNRADGYGGAVHAAGASTRFVGCRLTNNEAGLTLAPGFGGAVYVTGGSVFVERSRFCGNTAAVGGGAIFAFAADLDVTACVFRANTASAGSGGAVALNAAGLSMVNCLLYANTAGWDGGAIASELGTHAAIINTTIADNTAARFGGAIASMSEPGAAIYNSLIWANTPGNDPPPGDLSTSQIVAVESRPEVAYSAMEAGWAHGAPIYTPQDPRFWRGSGAGPDCDDTNRDRDYLLTSASTLVDAGYNAVITEMETDVADQPRMIGSFVDVGAYEMPPTGACCIGGCHVTFGFECAFVCNAAAHLPGTFAGCYGDVDGNGFVTPGDRGFVGANIERTDPVLMCLYDLDGNGFINAADRGFVASNTGICTPLPDWQNGSARNHGAPDARFSDLFREGMTCGTCP